MTHARRSWPDHGAAALAALLLAAPGIDAQIKASEAASLTQTIDGTTITIDYARPSLRGRSVRGDLFGEQIRWGYVWTPGANNATTITSDKDFRLQGMDVPAGSYSVWMQVEEGPWTLILDPDAGLWHTQGPDPSEEQFRTEIEATTLPYSVETLSWTMPEVRTDGAALRMQWGELAVDLELEVEPSVAVTMTADQAAPYLGTYAVEQFDTNYGGAHSYEVDFRHENDMLVAEMEFGPDFSMEVAFVAAAEQVFTMGMLMNGSVAEVVDYVFTEFVMGRDGLAESFEQRAQDDTLVLRGTRIR